MTTKTALPTPRFLRVPGAAALLALLLVALLPGAVAAAPGDPCAAPVDVIACENTKPGTPQAVWDVTGDGNQTIQGYATQMSVDRGEPVHFKVKTDAHDYRIELYRIGYYGGDGARLVDTIQPSASLPQSQPACLTDAATGLIDCGNWGVSATWNPPADAVSGVYAARLVRTDTGGESHMLFVMRDDERRSDVVVKTADETWAAYNNYGGVSLYGHGSGGVSWWSGRGYKVSYNRPLKMRESERFSSFFSAEYPLVRWMERNGYDVSYIAGIDAARRPAELLEHKLLVSSGHDEYWSHEQRANVEAARDAGVNLAFFSGNEIFWKTRWEPSIDGTATADRTLVSYKESNATTKIDPSPLWTGTWRDGRFSPPSDGGRPENALTGTLYMVNAFRNDPIEIPARFGKARLWRNTGIDTLAPGETASLPAGLLGYEWDVDADNGHRPPGLIRLSETTRDLPRELLLNHGTVYGAGRATHSLNLYRAASGALVFGAGTVQWAWGLDGRHDNDGPDQDRRTQQATVNLLADMTVQPRSLQSNLTPATASTDGTAPTVEITGPAAGTRFSRSDVVTITGTAQDAGGVVGGVEVSVDGGETWHYAKGHEQWEYRWNVTGFGAVDVRARAADDSGNIGQADQRTLEVGCPCSLWSNAISPGTTSFADVMSYELGVKFRSDVPGYVTGIRFYKGTANTGVHLGHLWDSLGNRLGEVRFEDETATGWQTASFAKPISVLPGTTYIASYYAPKGGYALDRPFFTQPVLAPPLRALADGEDGPNAVFKSGVSGFPTQTKQASNYWVDVVFDQDGTDRVGPGLLSTRPAASAESAPISADITAQFDEELDPASVNGGTFELRTAAGAPVAASVRYDAGTRSAVLDPAASLDLMTTYRATLRGGEGGLRDPGGNVLKGDREWTFTTFGCPCSLWSDAALPNITSHWDTQAYELGLKFRSEVNGYVTGIRFYKGSGNTGTHLGHLWTAAGVRLGEVRFENETATGWQTAKFSTPIAVSAGATYIASYFAPNGRYALDRPGFTTDRTRGPLRALADGEEGGNAVFRTGSSGFPTQSKDASNYWVDLVFHQDGTDRMAPRVLSTTPTAGSTSAALSRDIVVRFDEPIDHTTVTGSNLELTTADGAAVGASVRYDAATQTATIDPVALLSAGTSYRVVVRGGAGGVRDLAGNPLDGDHAWTFSTFTCPCSLWTSFTLPATAAYPDSQAYELGVKFRAEIDGLITGVRFYKGAGNTGTHLGHLWTAGGAQLGEVTFTNETATGWQTASFATPIPISAGTTYIASYHAPRGNYALNRPYFTGSVSSGPLTAPADGESGGNAVFKSGVPGFPNKSKEASNYWVDPVFVPAGG